MSNPNPQTFRDLQRNAQQAGNPIIDEIPGGTINGTNATFTLVNTPRSGSLVLFSDGKRVPPTGYTVSLVSGVYTIVLTTAPTTSLVADYRA